MRSAVSSHPNLNPHPNSRQVRAPLSKAELLHHNSTTALVNKNAFNFPVQGEQVVNIATDRSFVMYFSDGGEGVVEHHTVL